MSRGNLGEWTCSAPEAQRQEWLRSFCPSGRRERDLGCATHFLLCLPPIPHNTHWFFCNPTFPVPGCWEAPPHLQFCSPCRLSTVKENPSMPQSLPFPKNSIHSLLPASSGPPWPAQTQSPQLYQCAAAPGASSFRWQTAHGLHLSGHLRSAIFSWNVDDAVTSASAPLFSLVLSWAKVIFFPKKIFCIKHMMEKKSKDSIVLLLKSSISFWKAEKERNTDYLTTMPHSHNRRAQDHRGDKSRYAWEVLSTAAVQSNYAVNENDDCNTQHTRCLKQNYLVGGKQRLLSPSHRKPLVVIFKEALRKTSALLSSSEESEVVTCHGTKGKLRTRGPCDLSHTAVQALAPSTSKNTKQMMALSDTHQSMMLKVPKGFDIDDDDDVDDGPSKEESNQHRLNANTISGLALNNFAQHKVHVIFWRSHHSQGHTVLQVLQERHKQKCPITQEVMDAQFYSHATRTVCLTWDFF